MYHGTGGVTPHSIKMARLGVTQGHRVLQLEKEVVGGDKQEVSHHQEQPGERWCHAG